MVEQSRQHLEHVARGGLIGLSGAVVNAVSTFVLTMVVTTGFTQEIAGQFFAVTSLFLLLFAVVSLGADTGLGRFMLRYEAQQRTGHITAAIRAAIVPPLVLSTVVAVAMYAGAASISDWIGLEGADGTTAVRLAAIALPFTNIGFLALSGTRAFGRMGATAMVDSILRSGSQVLLALATSAVGAGLVLLAGSWFAAYVFAAFISIVLFRLLVRRRLRDRSEAEDAGPVEGVWAEFWSYSWARGVAKVAQMGVQRLDIVLIAIMLGPKQAAIYTAATRFVALGKFGTVAIQQVLQPKFTHLLATHDFDALRDVYRISTSWTMAIAWPVYVVAGCAPVAYLSLFGENYQHAGTEVVVLMAIGMMIALATGPADTLLLMSGRSRTSLFNSLTALTIDVVGCLVLIPAMGITGAALAWAVAGATAPLLAVRQVRMSLHVRSLSRPAVVVALANALCIGLPVGVLSAVLHLHVLGLLVAVLLCAPLYLAVLYLERRVLMLDVLLSALSRSRSPRLERATPV